MTDNPTQPQQTDLADRMASGLPSVLIGDCLDEMAKLSDCSVDAIVTDPPYGLSFMGAGWDHNVPSPEYWKEAMRVAKPGAHLLCFGGTRTFHRMACAIEDAGWEIRDCIMWAYGSGFPKSMDVGKAIDKALGAERNVVGRSSRGTGAPSAMLNHGNTETVGYANGNGREYDITEPSSDEAKEWDGCGTCLKPAWEPIIVARKPLDGTVAHNVMTYGTGAINIDGCRVPTNGEMLSYGTFHSGGDNGLNGTSTFKIRERHYPKGYQPSGRFPANLVHDGSDEVIGAFPLTAPSKSGRPRVGKSGDGWGMTHTGAEYDDSGSAARFFYCAKASKRDRGEGNDHPTVKPTSLMQWLVRLVCPQGGIVMDPFCGSGSTGVACVREGMGFLGIEMDPHYAGIAERRIAEEPLAIFAEV